MSLFACPYCTDQTKEAVSLFGPLLGLFILPFVAVGAGIFAVLRQLRRGEGPG